MKVDRIINLCTYAIQASPAVELTSLGFQITCHNHSLGLGALEDVVSRIACAVTAPIWLLKDLLLTAVGAGASISLNKNAIDLTKQSAINMGIDAVSPLLSLAGIVYSFCWNLQKEIKNMIPDVISWLTEEFNQHFNAAAQSIGGKEVVIQLMQWIEKNPKLTIEIAEEIPELKPFAKLLPSLALATRDSIPVFSDKAKFAEVAKRLEDLNTTTFAAMALTANKEQLALHGKILSKIDASLSYGATCLSAMVNVICRLFLITITAPMALFSMQAKLFLFNQGRKLNLNAKCLLVAGLGIFSPSYATGWVNRKIEFAVPKGLPSFIRECAALSKGNIKETIENVQTLIAFFQKLTEGKNNAIQKQLISIILEKSQDSENAEKITELLKLFPSLANQLPKGLLEAAPELIKVLGKHSKSAGHLIANLSKGTNSVETFVSQMDPEDKKRGS